jgi:hypothetical protein
MAYLKAAWKVATEELSENMFGQRAFVARLSIAIANELELLPHLIFDELKFFSVHQGGPFRWSLSQAV